ncbi:MAG TPA: glycosyltransferase family 4 protein [Solirubrobacteraceae bacterium]|jgi:glycosyltransferase involved in cell wall biosynthesis|nr:glycosyltransferase family 4 protein [Solirubrobacteraceae bacterium]
MKPVLFVTGHVPFDRVGAFARLHALEGAEFALFGGRSQHGGVAAAELPFPHRHIRQRELARLAAAGRHRAVVVSTGGRVALPAAWAGARRAGAPVILWSALWAHPRSIAHAFSYVALRRLYRSADAVVVYGPHVAAYVRARGARNVHVALQSVDNAFWGAPAVRLPATPGWPSEATVKFLFVGRPNREKGLRVLMEAWFDHGLQASSAALVLVGVGSCPPWIPAGGAVCPLDPVAPAQLREMYAAADVLVVPSIPTRTFREPWGLVVNEAMNRGLPVIASDAVGAAAGGLVRDERNGLVVPAGDAGALAGAMRRLAADRELRARLGAAGRQDVRAYTYDAWAQGFAQALDSLGLSRGGRW